MKTENKSIAKSSPAWLKREPLRIVYLVLIFAFCLLPLVVLFFHISSADLSYVFSDPNFLPAVGNSILYSLAGSGIATLLALISSYLLNRSNLKGKKIWLILLTLPMLVPSLSIGLGIRSLFGVKGFLDLLFGNTFNGTGFFDLILGSAIVAFPPIFLLLYDAFNYEDKTHYDAAEVMGISRFSAFVHFTLPYIRIPLFSAFLAGFTLVFSDYGVPMEAAGRVQTLPMYIYEQAMSSFQYGRASIACLFLLIPAFISFFFDIFTKDQNQDRYSSSLIHRGKGFDIVSGIVLAVISLFLFLPQLCFIFLAFTKSYPNDLSFTFDNFASVFTIRYGVGIGRNLINSLIISLLTGVIGTLYAFVLAYLTTRVEGFLGKLLHFFAISSIAIPGIVLGIGYIYLFNATNGWFYGTIVILIFVNIAHFLGSPYLMAKNALSKQNKDYEVIGSTLKISRLRIFFRVIFMNSLSTLLEMFSYFFVNSMVTISAVAFLCTFTNQPLSILITIYEAKSEFSMQAVLSFTILLINLVFRGLLLIPNHFLARSQEKKGETMKLTRYQFDLLTYLEKNGKGRYTQRQLSDILTISTKTLSQLLKDCLDKNLIQRDAEDNLSITEEGLKTLEPYRVRKAIILAAGFSSRLAPVTLNTPKPLVTVNGKRIIDTLLDALLAKGITDIIIVRGYKKEQFDVLLEKYPTIHFIDNDEFNTTNNITSLMKAIEYVDRCYICEADLIIKNPELIQKYQYATNYLGAKVNETDDWCFEKKGRYVLSYREGGENCYQAYGISYWNEEDCQKLKVDIPKLYHSHAGKEHFWESAPMKFYRRNYQIEIRSCHKSDIVEIDNFSELLALDSSYQKYPGAKDFYSEK